MQRKLSKSLLRYTFYIVHLGRVVLRLVKSLLKLISCIPYIPNSVEVASPLIIHASPTVPIIIWSAKGHPPPHIRIRRVLHMLSKIDQSEELITVEKVFLVLLAK